MPRARGVAAARAAVAAAALAAAGLAGMAAGCRALPTATAGEGGSAATPETSPRAAAVAQVLASRPAACPRPLRSSAGAIAFRGASAWQSHLSALPPAQRLAIEALQPDFAAGESAVLVDAGPLPNPGYRVAADQEALPVRAGVLQVRVRAVPPPAGSIQAQVLTNACLYLRQGRADYREAAVEVVR